MGRWGFYRRLGVFYLVAAGVALIETIWMVQVAWRIGRPEGAFFPVAMLILCGLCVHSAWDLWDDD